MERPANITDEHLTYLDTLRKSGVTNMFGAGHFLMLEFNIGSQEAADILSYWMVNFINQEE